MESPSVFLFAWLWTQNPAFDDPLVRVLGVAWLTHYVQRTFVFPALMRGGNRPNAVVTIVLAIAFNVLNASGNATSLRARPFDVAAGVGLGLFVVGFMLNLHSDAVLRGLRKPGETGYSIPHAGGYRWVASPNYLGELVEWLGFAIAAQTLAGWAFFLFTFANLAPRARSHHRWYLAQFPDYPRNRRALVPFLW
jgi:3-oxo-5-alpha-steroid 4-dehydrogenase 1